MANASEITTCHVNEIREVNKASTSPRMLPSTVPLDNQPRAKGVIILFIFYTPAVVETHKELQPA